MARFSLGARATGAATSVLPAGSLYAGATGGGTLREVGVTNTTTSAVVVALARFTTAGTSSSVAQVPGKHNVNSGPSLMTVRNVHSSTPPTLDSDLGYRITLGAAAGAAIIWTFGDDGIVIPIGTGQGIGIYTPTGTGQVCDFYFCWDE